MTLSARVVDLRSWVRETVDVVRWRTASKRLALALNLLVNAIKCRASEVVTLRVSLFAARRGRTGTLLLEVRDTGIGNAPDRFTHLFYTYWQENRASCPDAGGSGLGLGTCRELVELMRGAITVNSALHVETVFTIKLPVVVTESAPPRQQADRVPVQVDASAVKIGREAPRILIVDDQEAVRSRRRINARRLDASVSSPARAGTRYGSLHIRRSTWCCSIATSRTSTATHPRGRFARTNLQGKRGMFQLSRSRQSLAMRATSVLQRRDGRCVGQVAAARNLEADDLDVVPDLFRFCAGGVGERIAQPMRPCCRASVRRYPA